MRAARRYALSIASLVGLLLGGCAVGFDGGSGDAGGRADGGRRDGGGSVRIDAGPRRDGGSGCTPRGFAPTCDGATDLGMLEPGGRIESDEGVLARVGDAQWVRIAFPIVPMETPDGGVPPMAGGGTPFIRFLRNDGDVYRLEIRTQCSLVASCGEGGAATGMATNLTEWSFADDPALSEEGQGRFSTRMTPWPEQVYVRVYAPADPTCQVFQLEITR